MKARLLTVTTLFVGFCALLPARAADSQLLALVMPDAKVLAGVNVDQAKASPFGQYVLAQVQTQDQQMQQLVKLTGFDPTRDVHEVLAASPGNPGGPHTGLALALGTFDVAKITAVAATNGAPTERYKGLTILEDPKKTHGIVFLSGTVVAAGDLASVKGAIDRQGGQTALSTAMLVQVNKWSTSQDAWMVADIPAAALKPPANSPNLPAITQSTAFQSIQQSAGGVKFGSNVVVTAEAQADTAQNASAMADVVRLLLNVAQMQTEQNPQLAALVKSAQVTTSGATLGVSFSVPGDQFQQLLQQGKTASSEHRPARRHRPVRQM
jgi:hypothetical protein